MLSSIAKAIVLRIISAGKINMDIRQKLERHVDIIANKKGSINIGKAGYIKANTLIYANGGQIKIGDHFFANRNVSITAIDEITIGNRVQIANNVVMVDHNHDFREHKGYFLSNKIVVEDNVWIGANCVVLMGTHIGENSVIAAGSVVKGDIPPNTVYVQKKETSMLPLL